MLNYATVGSNRLDEAKRFYGDILGLPPDFELAVFSCEHATNGTG